jgi:hypothetical protein
VADGGRGLRDIAIGVGSGFATAATAVAAIVGVLHETGYLGAPAPQPAVIITAIALPSPAPAWQAQAVPSSAPSPATVSKAPVRIASPRKVPERRPPAAKHVAMGELGNLGAASRSQALAIAPEAEPSVRSAPAAHSQTSPSAALADVGPVPPPAGGIATLDGAWRDHGPGFCHIIKQTGGNFEIVNLAPITNGFISVGHGNIEGREIHLHLNDHHPNAAKADLHLSGDGQIMIGTIRRPSGEFPLRWYRSGTSCATK